jgi:hypothetical protein
MRQVSLVVIHRRASQTIDESLQIAHRLLIDRLDETKSVTLTENENNY